MLNNFSLCYSYIFYGKKNKDVTEENLHFLLYSIVRFQHILHWNKLKGAIKFIKFKKVCSNHVNCKQIVWTINQRRTLKTKIKMSWISCNWVLHWSSKATHQFFFFNNKKQINFPIIIVKLANGVYRFKYIFHEYFTKKLFTTYEIAKLIFIPNVYE